MLAAFWVSLRAGGEFDWLRHQPDQPAPFWPSLLTSISIMNGMVFACVLVIPDYARFVRRTERKAARRWVGAAFLSFCFGFQGLVGLWFSTRYLDPNPGRSEEHTSELQSLMRISYAVFCLKKN